MNLKRYLSPSDIKWTVIMFRTNTMQYEQWKCGVKKYFVTYQV